MSDRAEIADLAVRYTRALDSRSWDDFDGLFTEDAEIDYRAFGGEVGDLASIKAFLQTSMSMFRVTQHMLGQSAVTLDGDRATSVTPCHNPMLFSEEHGGRIMVCALWYHHELVRTPAGWRIARLWEERVHMTMLEGRDMGVPA